MPWTLLLKFILLTILAGGITIWLGFIVFDGTIFRVWVIPAFMLGALALRYLLRRYDRT